MARNSHERLRKKLDKLAAATLLGVFTVSLINDRMSADTSEGAGTHYQIAGNVTSANEFWRLNPRYIEILQGAGKNQQQTQYMMFVVENVSRVLSAGYPINPRVMSAIAPLENGYGTDPVVLKGNNFFGMKAYGADDALKDVPTSEYVNGNYIDTKADFQKFAHPIDSFYAHAEDIYRLAHYQDAATCFYDDSLYISALLGGEARCGGAPGEPRYATDGKYQAKIEDVIATWNLEQIFQKN